MSRRPACARSEACWLPCSCRRRVGLRWKDPVTSIVSLLAGPTYTARFVLLILALFSVISWGIVLHKAWTFSRAGTAIDAVSRCLPPQQQVLRSPRRLPIARRQSAGWHLSIGLRGVDGPAAAGDAGRLATDPIQARAPDVLLSRVFPRWTGPDACVGGRSEQARTLGVVSRDHGEHYAVHRTVRHGVGILIAFCQHRADRIDEPELGRSRHRGGAGHDRGRTRWRRSRRCFLQLLVAAREELCVRQMDDFSMEFLNIAERNFT